MEPRLEILAPAGDEECLRAAVGAGADAVYFGLSAGFNARAKAPSFAVDDLGRVMDTLHAHGLRGYVTLNTLVFDSELAAVEALIAAIARAGADAVIVQDLGVARLCALIAPGLPVHASTQMTVTAPDAAALAAGLGVRRLILPRELSISEIRRMQATGLDLECFVHGALCVSYSGQCLASAAWDGRSANRGLCAQPCRLPHGLVVDGKRRDCGNERYLLSTRDLRAPSLLGALVDAGVTAFKIEGRYKGPDYVAGAVEKYRRLLDALLAGRNDQWTRTDEEELSFTFSRGFSHGWLAGVDHRSLSHGLYPGHRGLLVGEVMLVSGFRVKVRTVPDAPELKAGDWMVFDQGDPEGDEPKGGIFSLGPRAGELLELRFGDPGPDLTRVRVGDKLWKSHDSAVKRRLLRLAKSERRLPVDLTARGKLGEPLVAEAIDALGRSARVTSDTLLVAASGRPLDESIVKDKLGSFGAEGFSLRQLTLELEGALALPPSELKSMRRALAAALLAQGTRPAREVHELSVRPWTSAAPAAESRPVVVPLCRTPEQVSAALAWGANEVILDLEHTALARTVEDCRARGVEVVLATPRVEKPGEAVEEALLGLHPDGLLLRHLAAVGRYRSSAAQLQLHGDFSLNVSNAVTARLLLDMGLATVAPATELELPELRTLAGTLGTALEVIVHQRLPLYHTQYCLYAHHLSNGHDPSDCGRPCATHNLSLVDARGRLPVRTDAHCRSTIFGPTPRTLVRHVRTLLGFGVRRLRLELLDEDAAATTALLEEIRAACQT